MKDPNRNLRREQKQISIRLQPDVLEHFDALAKERRLSRQDLAEYVIEGFVRQSQEAGFDLRIGAPVARDEDDGGR